jgi:Flp pilus assembly protein CpaB
MARRPSRVPAASRRDGLAWWVARHRRVLASAALALAVWAGLSAVRTRPTPGREVLVAAHDLPPGTVLTSGDVRVVLLPVLAAPPSALGPGTSLAGRDLAVAVPAGAPITTASLSVARVLPAGTVATSIRLADPASAALLRPGDHIDVLASVGGSDTVGSSDSGSAASTEPSTTVVAADLPVLSVPTPDTEAGDEGGLVVVAATPAQATALATAATDARLSVTLRGS